MKSFQNKTGDFSLKIISTEIILIFDKNNPQQQRVLFKLFKIKVI